MRNFYVGVGAVIASLFVGIAILGAYFFIVGYFLTIQEQQDSIMLAMSSIGIACITGMSMIATFTGIFCRYEKQWWME